MDWAGYLRAVVTEAAGAAAAVAAVHGGPIAAASAKAAAERVSNDLLGQFLDAHDEQMERIDEVAQEMRGRLVGLQDTVGGLLDAPWRTALAHIDEAGRRPLARERELELARVRLLDAWGVAEALLERNPRSADPAALRCPVIAQQIAAVYGFLGEPQNALNWLVKGYLASRKQLVNQVDILHDILAEKVKHTKYPAGNVGLLSGINSKRQLAIVVLSTTPHSDDPLWVQMPGHVRSPEPDYGRAWTKFKLVLDRGQLEGHAIGLATLDAETQLLRLTCLAARADQPFLKPGVEPRLASTASAKAGERRALRNDFRVLIVFSPMTAAIVWSGGSEISVTRLMRNIDVRYKRFMLPLVFKWPELT